MTTQTIISFKLYPVIFQVDVLIELVSKCKCWQCNLSLKKIPLDFKQIFLSFIYAITWKNPANIYSKYI